MKYAKINKYDATNWDGINATIFFSGCDFRCTGCFNESIQDFNVGEDFTREVMDQFIEHAKSDHIDGICILGGEPFQQKLGVLYEFVRRLKREVGKPIHMWTGFDFEFLSKLGITRSILECVDTVVDGLFDIDLKDLNLKYRGSSNQRVINVQESILRDEVVVIG